MAIFKSCYFLTQNCNFNLEFSHELYKVDNTAKKSQYGLDVFENLQVFLKEKCTANSGLRFQCISYHIQFRLTYHMKNGLVVLT